MLSNMIQRKYLLNGMWIHLALVVIIVGALVTHFFGVRGEIHLRADKAETVTVRDHSVSLFLWDFQILYDDENNPKDFLSELRLLDRSAQSQMSIDEGVVRMNKPLKYKGFRFCQADYDTDGRGVVLSYNYDPWGIGITYAGYASLLLAMIAFFFQPNTRFRALWKELSSSSPYLGKVGASVLAAFVIVMAFVMTKVVTPKPPLQPVLQTPLLGIHVSVIMVAYTLFAIIAINGIIALLPPFKERRGQLSIISQLLLYPALFCLTTGIFIGAVWANLSWGRYWDWDPKETWALITMIVYAALLHWPMMTTQPSSSTNKQSSVAYHVACIVAFLFVLFTYFGVSRLLGGLHSYR